LWGGSERNFVLMPFLSCTEKKMIKILRGVKK
jgi:hypothetical protein